MMKLSDKITTLRKSNGWSQEDFAEKLDVSRQAISRWENGTALPDAQNILRISKLFHVTADYLLNDDYEDGINNSAAEVTTEIMLSAQKKKQLCWYRILIVGLSAMCIAAAFWIVMNANTAHSHPVITCVKENEIAPTCTVPGSYDEVLYCTECGEEVLRTHIITEMPAHQFQNEKCIVCGEDQRERD